MAKQIINIGTLANDRTGDTWRDAFDKANDNFTELYDFDAKQALIFIAQESDFPTQDGSTITLDAGKVFIITASFTTAKNFLCLNGSLITAMNTFGPVITYSGTSSMFIGTDVNFSIEDLTVSCPTAQAFNFTDSVGGVNLFRAFNTTVIACTKWGTYSDMLSIVIDTSFSASASDGLSLTGTTNNNVTISRFALFSTSAAFIGIDIGSSVTKFEVKDLIFTAPAGAFGISGLTNSGNIPANNIAMLVGSDFSGGMTSLQNITSTDIRWSFRDNNAISDTIQDALLSFNGNSTATVISVVDTPVIVNATWTVVRSSFFTLTTGGRATFDGERNVTLPIDVSVGLISSGGGTIDVTVYVAKGGTAIADSATSIEISGSKQAFITIPWQEEMAITNFYEVFVENNTNTTNIIVESAKFRFA